MNGHAESYTDVAIQLPVRTSDLNVVYRDEKLSSPLEKTYYKLLKRTVDILISTFVIVFILSWMTPLAAIIIKLNSRGPVFFIQKRHMKNGQVFNCIKFRTMIVNENADTEGAYENDKRITLTGHIFRRTHLDELPQFLNVLVGDMSFIGPRPQMIAENLRNEVLIDAYSSRHFVKPGITGLAQSYGQYGYTENIETLNERLEMDLYYIKNWSPGMDIKIIARTIATVFFI
ncbi:sugar transferase [Chitinophagaceae bacterium 26-R-25]|nr:sugar transferase [Chitinophagaceae bacterium 26-R-25]